MNSFLFEDIVNKKDGFLRGPFGGALKKEIFVEKSDTTYKVYEQGVVLNKDNSIGSYYITKDYYDSLMHRFTARAKDILVSCSGVNYGAIYQLPSDSETGVINQALLRIRLNNDIVDDKYFIYLFENLIVKRITGGTGDSTIPNFPPMNVVRKIPIELPNIDIQQKIAKVLSDLDAKIELNNKINAELETMAKTLYDYWFVQFDFPDANGKPYKTSGGKMVWNDALKREIPEGWEVGTLLNISTFTNGLACQKFRPKENEDYYKVIKIREMGSGFTKNSELVSTNIPEKVIVYDGDILFSWSATLDVKIWTGGTGGLNQHIFKVTSKKYPKSYYYFELLNYLQHFKMIAELRKTTMGHITQDHLKESRITIPPMELIHKLDKIISPILEKKVKLDKENQELASLRDWLLPMLMNGQVTVASTTSAAEKGYGVEAKEQLGMVAEPELVYHKIEKESKEDRFELWLSSQKLAARGDIDEEVLRDIFNAMDNEDQ